MSPYLYDSDSFFYLIVGEEENAWNWTYKFFSSYTFIPSTTYNLIQEFLDTTLPLQLH